jgi:hypothetical protein
MSRTDSLIRAAVRALEENRIVLDALPDALSSVQLDIKIGNQDEPINVHMAPRWGNSMALASVGRPCNVAKFDFST